MQSCPSCLSHSLIIVTWHYPTNLLHDITITWHTIPHTCHRTQYLSYDMLSNTCQTIHYPSYLSCDTITITLVTNILPVMPITWHTRCRTCHVTNKSYHTYHVTHPTYLSHDTLSLIPIAWHNIHHIVTDILSVMPITWHTRRRTCQVTNKSFIPITRHTILFPVLP